MKVTVVTPTWNAIEHFQACIDSIASQACDTVEVEHVVVDAGSEDGTIELAREHGCDVRVGKDKGIFDAINKGSFDSTGELLGFLGADDVLLPGALAKVVKAYQKGNSPWVVGGIRWIDGEGKDLGGLAAPPSWMTPAMHASLGWNPIMHMATYIHRDFYNELEGFNIEYKDSGDYDIFSRALRKKPYTRLGDYVACFRRTGANNSAVYRDRSMEENVRITEGVAPGSPLGRKAAKMAMKLWFNGRNPGWALRKWTSPADGILR